MSVLSSIFAVTTSVSDLVNPRLWLTEAAAGTSTYAGVTVNPQTAVGLASYYACMRAISEDVGRLPLITYKRMGRGKDRQTGHYLYPMLHDAPNDMMTSMALRETMTQHAMGWGDGYGKMRRATGGRVRAIEPMHPSRVTIERSATSVQYRIAGSEFEDEHVVQDKDMIHIHGLGDDGIRGYSVATIAAESLGLSIGAQTYGSTFFGNGTTINGVLEHPESLTDEALKHLRESWSDRHGGPANAHKPAILEEGMQWKQIGVPPEDAQFLETRQFQTEEVCRWFRITPHKIQHLLHATYSNVEHLALDYVNDTLMPWLVRWEQEINRKLFAREPDVFAEHLVDGLLRGDTTARGEYYTKRFHLGTLSQNDIRELENENPIEDGDTYYIPANLVRTEDAAEGNAQTAPAAAIPEPGTGGQPQPDPQVPNSARVDLRPVAEDAVDRFMRKETKAASRAHGRYKGNRVAFQEWEGKFYAEHVAFVAATLQPVLTVMGAPRAAPDIAAWHCHNSRTRLAQRWADLDAELKTWDARNALVMQKIEEAT